jgi:hypothetical protein
MTAVTAHQLHLLHHTLGVNPERRNPYRNFFVAGPGHDDMDYLEALTEMGYMARGYRPAFLEDDDVVFQCTDAGRAYAHENLPQPPKYSRYDEYRRSECSEGFAWFLGIRVPEVEWNREWGKACRYRYVRRDWTYREDVAGEWKLTKKEAKASYKEALKQRRAQRQAFA